jgi:hypothetical protein
MKLEGVLVIICIIAFVAYKLGKWPTYPTAGIPPAAVGLIKFLVVLVVIALIIGLGFMLVQNWTSIMPSGASPSMVSLQLMLDRVLPWFFIGSMVILALFILGSFRRTITSTLWTNTGKRMFTYFAVLTLFFYVLYLQDPTAPLFTTPEGHGEIVLYYILVLVMGMVNEFLTKSTWLSAIIMMVIVFTIVGARTSMLYDFSFLFGHNRGATVATRSEVAPVVVTTGVVSEGGRCDGVLHTVHLGADFQPIRADCDVNWGINDNSPTLCIILIDEFSNPLPTPACRGHEAEFQGIPITGWQTAGGTAFVDVIYR